MRFPASSSSSSNLNPIDSGSTSHYQPISVFTLSILRTTTASTGTALGLHPLPSFPPKKGRENRQLPLPTSHQATSYLQHLHHVANPLCNSTSLTISLASLRHFYLVQIPQNNHRRGGASAAVAAGLFQETDADIGLSPETRIISAQDPFHGQGVVPHPPRGNEDLLDNGSSAGSCYGCENTHFYSHVFLFRLCFLSLRQPKVGLVTCCVIAIW